jgi:hypothetical protein
MYFSDSDENVKFSRTSLPEHISLWIQPSDIDKLVFHLNNLTFRPTIFQIYKKNQIFSKITDTEFGNSTAELHVRVFKDGKIEGEYEPPRLKRIFKHITSRSYSAHEFIISTLDSLGIDYKVDEVLRHKYNIVTPIEFKFKYDEFFKFLYGTLFVSSYWIITRISHKIKRSPVPTVT